MTDPTPRSVGEHVDLDAQLRWIAHLRCIDAAAEAIEQAIEPIKARAARASAAREQRESEHYEVAELALERIGYLPHWGADISAIVQAAVDDTAEKAAWRYEAGAGARTAEEQVFAEPVAPAQVSSRRPGFRCHRRRDSSPLLDNAR
jgi:hypothetical protein